VVRSTGAGPAGTDGLEGSGMGRIIDGGTR
jgi:hypothetical protein